MLNFSANGLLVVGMHRSGTSCLAGMLQMAGFHAGLVERWNPDNRKGHRENLAIMELNDSLLKTAGGAWHAPVAITEWTDEQRSDRELILKELASTDNPWMFKDPRTLFTLPFWLEVMPDIRMIGIARSPIAVAGSLAARGSISLSDGLRLWEVYNRSLLKLIKEGSLPLLLFSENDASFMSAADKILKDLYSGEIDKGIICPELMREFYSESLIHQPRNIGHTLLSSLCEAGLSAYEAEAIQALWLELVSFAENSSEKGALKYNQLKTQTEINEVIEEGVVNLLVSKGEISAALMKLESLLVNAYNRPDLWRRGIEILRSHGENEQLGEWIDQGLDAMPDDPLLMFEKARIDWSSGRREQAIRQVEKVCLLTPGWVPPIRELANWYFAIINWQSASDKLLQSAMYSSNSATRAGSLSYMQLFCDSGSGFSEEVSIRLPHTPNIKVQEFEFDLTRFNKLSKIRLDPINDYALVKIDSITLVGAGGEVVTVLIEASNANQKVEGIYYFCTVDPQLFFKNIEKELRFAVKLVVRIEIIHKGVSALEEYNRNIDVKLERQRVQIEELKMQLVEGGAKKQQKPLQKNSSDTLDSPVNQFIASWNLEDYIQDLDCSDQVVLQGWFQAKADNVLHLALRYLGKIRSYPLNEDRLDIVEAVNDQGNCSESQLKCGFRYLVPEGLTIEIGVECDANFYWLRTLNT